MESMEEWGMSEEHRALRKLVRDFAREEVEPIAREIDETGRFPTEIVRRAGELGLLGAPFPEEVGGSGLGETGYCILNEEINYASASVGTILGAHVGLACKAIYYSGDDGQKERYLKPMVEGRTLGAFALTEPQAGSDSANIKTQAVRDGDGWVLNGEKIFITNGATADAVVTFAVTPRTPDDKGGVNAFVVEKSFDGFKPGPKEKLMGIRGSSTNAISFENCRVPGENLLGPPGGGFLVAMKTLDAGRVGLGAGCLGMARRCMDLSARHAMVRIQFGKPLFEQQAVQFMLAEMAADFHAGKCMVYDAARRMDEKRKITKESAIVKLFCSEMANRCADKAVQIHGGMGYVAELPVERFYRDARVARIYEGASEIQKLVIAMQLKREYR